MFQESGQLTWGEGGQIQNIKGRELDRGVLRGG